MRVLFFHAYPHQYAGAQRVTHELCRVLEERGVTTAVATVDDGPFPDRLRATGTECLVVRAPAAWRLYGRQLVQRRGAAAFALAGLPRYWGRLARGIRRWAPDVVHVNDHRGALLSAVPSRLAGIPLVWHLHGTWPNAPITHLGGSLAGAILVVSQDTRDRQPHLNRYDSKTSILHNGLLTLSGTLLPARPALPPIVLTGARSHPDKGLDVLIRSAAVVRQAVPDVRFHVAGPVQRGYERYHAELQQLRDDLGLGEVITFLGEVERPQDAWSEASVYVQPSRREPFGMGVIEAMALGVPVVTTRVGGMRETVEDGRSGLQVDPEDAPQLGRAIVTALTDEPLRSELIAAGKARVAERFTVDAMVNQLMAKYERIRR